MSRIGRGRCRRGRGHRRSHGSTSRFCTGASSRRRFSVCCPGSVELQTFDGAAWLGITPFLLSGLRLRGLPPLPGVSTFPELNVRTYVTRDERPGIWFFTLDVGSTLVGEAEKRLYRLPYHRAQMRYVRDDGFVNHESARAGAAFSASYRGVGDVFDAEAGSLDEFLTDRYCVYTEDGGRVYRADLHHRRWQLQQARRTST